MDSVHTITTESEWETRGIDRNRSGNWKAVGWSPDDAAPWEVLRPHFKAACVSYTHRGFVQWCIEQRALGETPETLEFRVRREAQIGLESRAAKAGSRPQWRPRADRRTSIERINDSPMEQLTFREFERLKVEGKRDQYSAMRLPKLQGLVSPEVKAEVEEVFQTSKNQATCYRWVLRGLRPDRAIRKVKTDLEVTDNAIKARSGRS